MDQTQQDQGIESSGPYYEGWLAFTRWARWGIIGIAALLAVLAATLV